ncbi:GNAT family N-acetyltransferase [Streptomyces sp. CBMA152]|uniref:GNAT family N-acetyltransferase n=1 Tax=Streptomyces sp. CBMA152 TaxID=1896312 RepID=UPI00166049C4|nr:GNAT family N-acetyltransferase [Streptomyces sp. CBMA152]MBD0744983.1 glycosyl transferase family 1 [Streptomyces sp. CBMA152]
MEETTTSSVLVEVCTDAGRFGALAPEWRRLHARCRTATPFQSHAWLHSWWLSYGVNGRLRVVLVRRNGELVAAAPLMLTYRPYRVLVGLGGAISDYKDVLLDDTCAAEAAHALVTAVRETARGALVDLREVRPSGAAELLHTHWPGARASLPDSACLELPSAPMDELLTRLAANRAQRVRAKLRKIDALGVTERAVPVAEVPSTLEALLSLHQMQWRGRGVTREHVRPRFADHLTRSVRQMVADGEAVVTEFRLEDRVVAVDLTLRAPSLTGAYLYGAHPGLRARKVDVATLLLRSCTRTAHPSSVLSLLRGNEPYKHHWRPEPTLNQRYLLAGRARWTPLLWWCVGYARVRGRVAGGVRRVRGWRGAWKRRNAST